MNSISKPARLMLVSPWFLLLFLIVPILVVLNVAFHLGLPFATPKFMLVSNSCFALVLFCRLLWHLLRIGQVIRYDGGAPRRKGGFDCRYPADQARGVLSRGGYAFAAEGSYGEKRDFGYLGTVVLYAGLLLLVATGTYDNMRLFSGVILDGVGPATDLRKVSSFRSVTMGPFSSRGKDLPQLRILSQILPDSTYPKGGTEIGLVPEKGDPETTLLLPGNTYRHRAYDIYMTKLVFQPEIVIKTKDGHVIFDDFVQLDPLVQKRGEFSFYGPYAGAVVLGGVYYQPEKNLMMMVVTHNGKRVVADMTFQTDQQVTAGNYVVSCAKMGQWSEIHVVHHRHKELLLLGGIIAALGLLLRIAVRPQRVWLEETDGGCRVFAVGKESMKLLKAQ